MARATSASTVAILAQGTFWAVAATQAFSFTRDRRESDEEGGAELPSRPGRPYRVLSPSLLARASCQVGVSSSCNGPTWWEGVCWSMACPVSHVDDSPQSSR